MGLLNEGNTEMGKGAGAWIGSIWLKTATTVGCSENRSEQWSSIKHGEYVD